jgi:hypothetical protein
MSKLREIIRDERRRQHGAARGPLVVIRRIVEPILSSAGDRVVGSRTLDTNASAIVGAACGRIWQQPGESLQAFEERVKAAAGGVSVAETGDP